MLFRISYVGTQAHHLLASRDLDAGNAQTCAEIGQIYNNDPTGTLNGLGCGPVGADGEYQIPTTYSDGSPVIIPAYNAPTQPFKVPAPNCSGLPLPYNAGSGGNCIRREPISLPAISLPTASRSWGRGRSRLRIGKRFPPERSVARRMECRSSAPFSLKIRSPIPTTTRCRFRWKRLHARPAVPGIVHFSKAIDQGASFEQQLNPLNFNADRGLSLLSAKHRFVFSPVWDLPIPKQEGVAGKFANGWQVSAIITYQSGFRYALKTRTTGSWRAAFSLRTLTHLPSTARSVRQPKEKWRHLLQLE